ncbi:Hypothetical protein Tpal_717 [Trichococcus palustris]|jgi:hypothetical protein|uniref:Uncharacterized protein n=1 Tax=Trichococcus palustris TaxID=140314 RepID=A0A143YD95_9LACT|nr:Hypothetical protein Tpal_717 [Trichococcus palustris]SFK57547.1 hypothetical protein SAMN04488076_101201 [Trichococcus palustris]
MERFLANNQQEFLLFPRLSTKLIHPNVKLQYKHCYDYRNKPPFASKNLKAIGGLFDEAMRWICTSGKMFHDFCPVFLCLSKFMVVFLGIFIVFIQFL